MLGFREISYLVVVPGCYEVTKYRSTAATV